MGFVRSMVNIGADPNSNRRKKRCCDMLEDDEIQEKNSLLMHLDERKTLDIRRFLAKRCRINTPPQLACSQHL